MHVAIIATWKLERSAMSAESKLQLQLLKVSKTYGEHNVNALANVDLNVKQHEFVALMGPSGCGKSTLLNLIAGVDRPTSGQVFLAGEELSKMSDEQLTRMRAAKLGFVFQFFNLLSTLTVAENVALPLELMKQIRQSEIRERVAKMLERLGLSQRAEFYPSQLSGGEMQRTAIGRALIHEPEVILADEPTGNLDTVNGKMVLELLDSVHRGSVAGTGGVSPTILMATHSPDAASYAKRVIEMKDGCIVADTTLKESGDTA